MATMDSGNTKNRLKHQKYYYNTLLQDCEWCRIYSPEFVTADDADKCTEYCTEDSVVASCSEYRPEPDDLAETRGYYGQAMFTQFVGMYIRNSYSTSLSVVLYWRPHSTCYTLSWGIKGVCTIN